MSAVADDTYRYSPVRAKPAVLEDGTIVSGTSVETYRSWACWIERSAAMA